jgi:ferredoxin
MCNSIGRKQELGKADIKVNPQECKGCLNSQLRCSLAYTGAFNPEKARLIIEPLKEIRFTDDCIKDCILCAKYCPFGALEVVR